MGEKEHPRRNLGKKKSVGPRRPGTLLIRLENREYFASGIRSKSDKRKSILR